MDLSEHWEHIYRTKAPNEVSWFQPAASLSLALIQRSVVNPDAAIIDIGAGASTLVDGLISAGYRNITVLDLARSALVLSQQRLVQAGINQTVAWIHADVLTAQLPDAAFDVWHDRAVFHFLTAAVDRARYVDQVRRVVRVGGFVLVATFADDGPMRCSGLEVVRYTAQTLHREFGHDFQLVESVREEHVTPWGACQVFTYCVFRYVRTPL